MSSFRHGPPSSATSGGQWKQADLDGEFYSGDGMARQQPGRPVAFGAFDVLAVGGLGVGVGAGAVDRGAAGGMGESAEAGNRGGVMELGKYLVVWLSAEAIETLLGILGPSQDTAMTTWTVAGQVVGKAGSGLWIWVKRVLMPDGREQPLHEESIYFLRWELLTTARLYDALPADVRGIG